jgi:hypothetical protein
MRVYWVILFATLVPVQVSCFTECHPFHLYWQVVPDPGTDDGLLSPMTDVC